MILIYLADAVWILALSAMSGAARGAARQIPKDARLPILFVGGRPVWRASRNFALAFLPVAGTVAGLALLVDARGAVGGDPNRQLILFGVRVLAPSVLALAHMLWLRATLVLLDREGALKP